MSMLYLKYTVAFLKAFKKIVNSRTIVKHKIN